MSHASKNHDHEASCCGHDHGKGPDLLLWGTSAFVVIFYALSLLGQGIASLPETLTSLASSTQEIMNDMWWGLVLGIIFVGFLKIVPESIVFNIIGKPGTKMGIIRATLAGLLLDLCSHGILLVGMQLYRKGASIGQTMAFLIASPWNSLSLTVILIALIGLKWTIVFMALSAVIAIVSGLIFDALIQTKTLPSNPHKKALNQNAPKGWWKNIKPKTVLSGGWHESKMLLRWVFLGVVLASLIQTFINTHTFQEFFGPSPLGLVLTLVAATIIEVCSEGSAPIAADLLNRAGAVGNAFTFMMAGAATDYTEIMGLRETTGSWKIALFLPLITVPQVLILGYILNTF